MSKLPSFQFYPGDWLKDPALRMCSAGARGIWMDVLCLMFESPHRGYLPWTLHQIACALTGNWEENLACLKELVKNGVMRQAGPDKKSPWKNSAFFSARLVRQNREREVWRSQKRRQLIEKKRSHSTPISSPSSSSSSSSKLTTTPLPPASGGEETFRWGFENIAVQMGRRKRLPDLSPFQGSQAKYVAEFLEGRGFPARVIERVTEIA